MKTEILCALLAIPAVVLADDWGYVADSNQSIVYIHKTRIEQRGNNDFKFWVRYVPHGNRGALLYPNNPRSPRYVEQVSQLRVLCNEHTLATIAVTYYDSNGAVVASQSGSEFVFLPVVPDSIGDALHKNFCSWERQQPLTR